MNKKPVKRKRLVKKEFVKQYVPRYKLFYGQEPTKEDIDSTYIQVKNDGKRKRVKPKTEPEMSREEFIERHVRNSKLWGEVPNVEEEANRWWDLEQLERQYHAIREKTKKQTKEKKAAFREHMEQVIADRYSLAKIEERRLQRETEIPIAKYDLLDDEGGHIAEGTLVLSDNDEDAKWVGEFVIPEGMREQWHCKGIIALHLKAVEGILDNGETTLHLAAWTETIEPN